jgi:hypothetical protein
LQKFLVSCTIPSSSIFLSILTIVTGFRSTIEQNRRLDPDPDLSERSWQPTIAQQFRVRIQSNFPHSLLNGARKYVFSPYMLLENVLKGQFHLKVIEWKNYNGIFLLSFAYIAVDKSNIIRWEA